MLRSIDVAAHAGTAFDGKWNAAASRNDSVERHQIVEIVELEGTNLLDHGRETPPRTAAEIEMRDPVWPCFGRERGPTSPNKAQRRGLRQRLK